MGALELATRHAQRQQTIARRTTAELTRLWAQVDRGNVRASWSAMLPRALALLAAGQATAALSADPYVDQILGAAAGDAAGRIVADSLAGVASDGRPLVTLLQQPSIVALRQIAAGNSPARALAAGGFTLDLITRTQVADAGRVAVGTAIVARPHATGYVRLVVGATCARCLILAGKRYRWNAGFQRHPRCDCCHVPAAEDAPGDIGTDPRSAFRALSVEQQDRVFGKAGAEAIRNGADMAKVVNARRGIRTAADGRLYTTEAAGRRPRLMPEQIMREAQGNRGEALRLLRLHGYLS